MGRSDTRARVGLVHPFGQHRDDHCMDRGAIEVTHVPEDFVADVLQPMTRERCGRQRTAERAAMQTTKQRAQLLGGDTDESEVADVRAHGPDTSTDERRTLRGPRASR